MGQESKSSLVGWFWFSVSHEVSIKMSVRAAAIWGSMAEGSVSKLAAVVVGRPVLFHMDVSRGCLSTPWLGSQLPPEFVIQGREREKKRKTDTKFCHFISEVTYIPSFIFYWSHRPTLLCERRLYKGLKTRRQGSLGAILAVIGWLSQLWFKIPYLVIPIVCWTVSTL